MNINMPYMFYIKVSYASQVASFVHGDFTCFCV